MSDDRDALGSTNRIPADLKPVVSLGSTEQQSRTPRIGVDVDWQRDLDQYTRGLRNWQLGILMLLACCVIAAFLATLAWGSVSIPLIQTIHILFTGNLHDSSWATIVLGLRLPRAITAIAAGIGLGVSGLQMQALFRNALADPYILGVSSGATLGVGVVVLSAGSTSFWLFAETTSILRNLSIVVAAASGAGIVLALMFTLAARIDSPVVILVVGVMVGSFVSAFVSVLIFFSTPESIRSFATWGFGSFQTTQWGQIPALVGAVLVGTIVAGVETKQLNALLLGDEYAVSLGVSVRRARLVTLVSASLIAGAVTAYCGPIAFLGIAVPHLARGLFRTSNHRILMPAVVLLGALAAIVCGIFAELPGYDAVLPLNAATALLGAPVVIWVLVKLGRASTTFGV